MNIIYCSISYVQYLIENCNPYYDMAQMVTNFLYIYLHIMLLLILMHLSILIISLPLVFYYTATSFRIFTTRLHYFNTKFYPVRTCRKGM